MAKSLKTFLFLGKHYYGAIEPGGTIGEHYTTGAEVKSTDDLDEMFKGQFKRIHTTNDQPVKTQKTKKGEDSPEEEEENEEEEVSVKSSVSKFGKEITSKHPTKKKVRIFKTEEGIFNVINSDTEEVVLSTGKFKELKTFLKTPTK